MHADADRWISQREATRLLARGIGIPERQVRRVLAAGLAGQPRREPGMVAFSGARILDLLDRAAVSEVELDRCCPPGLFVALSVVAAVLDVALVFFLWHRDTNEFLRGAQLADELEP